jgi:teichuronic acid biosynthesis glycosyltransferase TuaG
MPAYNCERYIELAAHSVINQTFQDWELIVIDDGSTDRTVDIIKTIATKDNRIRVIVNENNQGVSKTRNKGISIAKGDWIAFLDSDDMWERTKLEKQLDLAKQTSAEFVFTGSSFINEDGDYYKGIFQIPEKVSYQQLRNQNVISCSSVLVKKRFFATIKMEKDEMHEDYAVWLRILQTGIVAYGINEPLLIYRLSRNSKSGNKLKTVIMTYRVFRFLGLNPLTSFYFMLRHVLGSVKKYRSILSNKKIH